MFGLAVALLLLATPWRIPTRILVGWDSGVALYLVLIFWIMERWTADRIRQRACVEDEGAIALLVLTTASAVASLAAVISELGHAPGAYRVTLGAVTILLSWGFMHVIFALHYAHEYYEENGGKGGGLSFPGELKEPNYWDFVYFSLVIGMTNQVSDVTITCRPIRHTVSAHAIVSFFFNVALLALMVNIAASAI